MKLARLTALFAALLAIACGCSYRLVGAGGGAETVGLSLSKFDDRSREPLFGPKVVRELARRGLQRAELAVGAEGGYGLELRLLELSETPRAFNRTNVPSEYLLSAKADIFLLKGSRVVWKNMGASARRSFAAGVDVASTAASRERALDSLAEELAGEILRRSSLAAREHRQNPAAFESSDGVAK